MGERGTRRGFGFAATVTAMALAGVACGASPGPDPASSGSAALAPSGSVPATAAPGDARPSATAVALASDVPDATTGAPSLPRVSLPVEPGSPVEGLVDVGGHALFARCSGTGSPTVVYFAGWTDVDATRAVDIAWGIEQALGRGVRVCSYERRNTGRSDTVPGTQEPEEIIADINGLLAALGEDGPLVLLGASFGGLVASAYAVAHPDRVAGVVLLDASTAVEHDIAEQAGFTGMCAQTERDIDAWMSIERIDNCALAAWIRERRDREPAVPMVYLAAAGSEDRGTPADDVRRAWVETWSPGTWRVVDEPHWIDKSNPGLVADAVREVIAASAMP